LTSGFSLSLFRKTTGLTTESLEPFLEKAITKGFLTRNLDEIKPTAKGQLFLNDLLLLAE
jgi:oxygen-independent coproporphyrinogen-3 oxidase